MSIGVSAVVRPSSCVRLLQAGFCCAAIASSAWCDGRVGAVMCVIGGLAGMLRGLKKAKASRIDIFDVGQLRLTVYQHAGSAHAAVPVSLLAGSTLWPRLLLLRLGPARGAATALLVLPGTVDETAFRPLALACRAIAARSAEQECMQKKTWEKRRNKKSGTP